MGAATYNVPSFLGGEISQFAQGRFDKPDYHISLNVCFNAFPVEIGPWTRRPGTQYAGWARGGTATKVVKFDFEQASPVTLEFTAGFLRFRSGTVLLNTNDTQTISAVSSANPAVVQTAAAHGWSTGNTVIPSSPSVALLENRQFTITVVDSTHFSIADALTGVGINGATLGSLTAGATISRVQELATVYVGNTWSSIRAVQAETTDILLTASAPPQALTVTTLPSTVLEAQFAIAAATFNDGPYLDPFTNGVQAVPSAQAGVITLTLQFPAYSSTISYAKGSFVTSSSVNYESLIDQNVGNTPASNPSDWAAVSAGVAINNGQGFLGTDIGRLVRLYSEPALWASGTTYAAGAVVSYNPSGQPGAATYWQSLVNSDTGNPPGANLTDWELLTTQGAAVWTWGKVTSLANQISGTLSGSTNIGSMTNGGGLAAAFNGNTAQSSGVGAEFVDAVSVLPIGNTGITNFSYVGKNYTGASAQAIGFAVVYPSTDLGFTNMVAPSNAVLAAQETTINLRASNSLPANSSNGTLLGTFSFPGGTTAAEVIQSNNTTSTWNYVWIEIVAAFDAFVVSNQVSASFHTCLSQVQFFNPTGTGTSANAVNVEILGPPLLYTNPVITWRLGVYSNTTGFPSCGCYADGRLWLGGAVANRFDACVSNGISGTAVNFAPTDPYGVVSADNAISEVLNSDSVNPIYWMESDQQGVIMGTLAGEWLIFAPSQGSIAPDNIDARPIGKHGCANIEPRRTEHTLVAVQRYARKLLELFPDVFSGKFTAPNLADKAQHIVRNFIAEMAYTSAAAPILWMRDQIGNLFGITYKRDTLTTSQGPTFYAWHRHSLGSGRTVQSICAGPSTDGTLDTLTMATVDPTTGIYHVELLTDAMDEQTPLANAWFLDDAVNPSSTSTTNVAQTNAPYGGLTINGLWHLNGKTVQVFAGGLDCGDSSPVQYAAYNSATTYAAGALVSVTTNLLTVVNYVSLQGSNTGNAPATSPTFWQAVTFLDFTVSNGSIFVPYGDGISAGPGRGLFTAAFAAGLPLSQIVVGFTYTSQGQLVRPIMPAETGARNGPALAKMRRTHRNGALLSNTLGISFGTSFTASGLLAARFTLADRQTNIPPLTTFSGVFEAPIFDQYSYDSMISWQVSRPWPATVVAIAGNLQTQDQ